MTREVKKNMCGRTMLISEKEKRKKEEGVKLYSEVHAIVMTF